MTVAKASKEPAAPIMCPVIDLVALMARDRRAAAERSPKTVQIASDSRASPTGVEVPCGLIRSTSSAGTPRRSRAIFMARADPTPFSIGWVMSPPAAAGPQPPPPAGLCQLEILEEEPARALTGQKPVARAAARARHGLQRLTGPGRSEAAHV